MHLKHDKNPNYQMILLLARQKDWSQYLNIYFTLKRTDNKTTTAIQGGKDKRETPIICVYF